MKILKIVNYDEKASIVKEILSDLPEWFGIAEARTTYIQESKELFYGLVLMKVILLDVLY